MPQLRNSLSHHQALTVNVLQGLDSLLGFLQSLLNLLSLGLGLPTLAYGVFVLATSVMSDFAGFIGMVVMGAVY